MLSRHVTRILRWTLFILLMALGLVALTLPIVPQLPFFIGAVIVIMPESRTVRKRYILWRRRHPRFFHAIERWRRQRREARTERKRLKELQHRAADRAACVAILAGTLVGGGAGGPRSASAAEPAAYEIAP